jgi:hypothetical protein
MAMAKFVVYVHCEEGSLGPPHTKKVAVEEAASAGAVLTAFISSYQKQYGKK